MKTLLGTLLALAAIVTLPAPSEAQGGGVTPSTASVLRAKGHGTVHFGASGKLEFRMKKKNGTLVIEDVASHTVKLEGLGNAVIKPNGDMVVTNFMGTVDVIGNGVKGHFLKGPLRMKAVGHGMATFKGKGGISVDGSPVGTWTKVGTQVTW